MSLLQALSLFGQGFLSAVWPIANAEVLISAWGLTADSTWAVVLGTLVYTVGHTLGKCVIFLVVRRELKLPRGGGRLGAKLRAAEAKVDETVERGPVVASALLVTSSAGGIPPLLILTVLYARTSYNFWAFTALTFVGRLVRFGALALGVDYLGGLPWG